MCAAIALLPAVQLAAPMASAQEASAAEVAAARRLFRQGMRAGRQEQWAEAREAFERAYAIVPRPRVLLNLASAQMQTGQLVEATNSYRRFLSVATGAETAEYREGVEEELASLEERTPQVRIEVTGLGGSDEVHVDGRAVSRAVLAVPLPLNPGSHEISVVRDGETVASESVALDEGAERDVTLDAASALPAPTLADEEPDVLDVDEEDTGGGGGLLSSVWFWTGAGAIVAGAVVVTLVVLAGGDPDRRSGNFGDGRLMIE